MQDPSGRTWRVSRRWVPWRRRGRHWIVEVRRGWRPWWEAESGDWRASELRIHEIADAIRRGALPP